MRVILSCIFVFFHLLVFAQQSIQELEEQLQQAGTSQEKLQINYQLGEAYLVSNVRDNEDKALPYAKRAHDIAKQMGNDGMAARTAFLVGRIYESDRGQERNQEVWYRTAESYARTAGDSDLIIKSVIKRGTLATKERNYRRATQIYESAFNYFSAKGTSISELESRYEQEKANLERQKRQLEQERTDLQSEIQNLAQERDQLSEDKTELQASQEQLIRAKERVEEEISTKEEELATVEEAKEEAERLAQERAKEVKQLSREALELELLAQEAENERNLARLAAARSQELTNLALILAGFLIVVAFLLYSRFRSKRRAARILESKNKTIEEERQRSDELLLNILPAPIAEELKESGKAKARKYDEVSVLFSDFKNFTGLAQKMSPEDLVEELDKCFREFDAIISDYIDIEKIKTIGDSYMCASGLSERKILPSNLVRAALRMQSFLEDEKKRRMRLGKTYFEARIGIHTGPAVAGVVGVKKFAYDIWGDTVNTASRIESNGHVGHVSISETTYNLVKYNFRCNYRGKVEAKNKGLIDLYEVVGEMGG